MVDDLGALRGTFRILLTDLDGTLTTAGRIESETLKAIEGLAAAGIAVVIVTGRPAGWAQAFAETLPVRAVVSENGGVTFIRTPERLARVCPLNAQERASWREKMMAAVEQVQAAVPSAELSSDSAYREVDLAIDWNEQLRLELTQAQQITQMLTERGFTASQSSVHINFSPPGIDKLTACNALLAHETFRLAEGGKLDADNAVYVGDALNDASMFGGFPHTVGVANVRDWWDQLTAKPRFVTNNREGAGFRELAKHLLAQRPSD